MCSLKSLKLLRKFSYFSLQFYNKSELIAFCDAAEVTVLIFMLQSISLLVTYSAILRYPQISPDILRYPQISSGILRYPQVSNADYLKLTLRAFSELRFSGGCLTSPHAERDALPATSTLPPLVLYLHTSTTVSLSGQLVSTECLPKWRAQPWEEGMGEKENTHRPEKYHGCSTHLVGKWWWLAWRRWTLQIYK